MKRVGVVLSDQPAELGLPIRVQSSPDRQDCLGRAVPFESGWSVAAGDMAVDQRLPARPDWRHHGLATRIAEVVERANLEALQVNAACPSATAAASAASLTGIPLVVEISHDLSRLLEKGIAAALLGGAYACVCRTHFMARTVGRLLAPRCPVYVVPMMVDLALAGLRPLILPFPEPRLVSLGNPVPGGDFSCLLEACKRLPSSLLIASEQFAGTPLPPRAHVVPPGDSRQRSRLIKACQGAILHTPRAEGEPRLLLEAMLAGRPLLASRVAGHEELLDDGLEGYLIDPPDAGAWTACLKAVLDGGGQSLARHAAKRIRALHSPLVVRRAWARVYG